jgi:hypothetical protein
MTVLAVVGGLAFAAGAAFWMLKHSRQQSRYDQVLATLSDMPVAPAGAKAVKSSVRTGTGIKLTSRTDRH